MEAEEVQVQREEVTEPIVQLVTAGLEEYKSQVDDYFGVVSESNPKQAEIPTFVCLDITLTSS